MKITLMILLVVTIMMVSHLAAIRGLTMYGATDQLSRSMAMIRARVAKGTRTMWISIFAIAIVAAASFVTAALILQRAEIV